MIGQPFRINSGPWHGWLTGAALLAACWATPAWAQTEPAPLPDLPHKVGLAETPASAPAGDVVQAGCSTCGGGLLGSHGGCSSCGRGGLGPAAPCYPGRKMCDCHCDSKIGQFFLGFYECICCNDPCYEPAWIAVANNAFFVDAARPVTQTRLRFDTGYDLELPDRAEYFWARADGKGKGPRPVKGPAGQDLFGPSLMHRDLSLYTEVATTNFGFFVEIPYRQIDPEILPGTSGFSDMNLGTKSLLLDCELMQFTFQFRTFIPIAAPAKGLGTGHVSLEPSFLVAVKLTPDCYFQGQLAYWIPVGGDQDYQGNVFHYHFSINKILWCCGHDLQLIGNLEFNGWEFMNGNFTNPATGLPLGAREFGSIFSLGPGVRLVFCDKIDFGVGSAFAISADKLDSELIRAEFRWRF